VRFQFLPLSGGAARNPSPDRKFMLRSRIRITNVTSKFPPAYKRHTHPNTNQLLIPSKREPRFPTKSIYVRRLDPLRSHPHHHPTTSTTTNSLTPCGAAAISRLLGDNPSSLRNPPHLMTAIYLYPPSSPTSDNGNLSRRRTTCLLQSACVFGIRSKISNTRRT